MSEEIPKSVVETGKSLTTSESQHLEDHEQDLDSTIQVCVQTERAAAGDAFPDFPKTKLKCAVDLRFLLKAYGCCKILQLMGSSISLMCLLSTSHRDREVVIDLPMHWRLKYFGLLILASLIYASFFIVSHACSLPHTCPFEWHKVDLLLSVVFAVGLVGSSGLVMEAAIYYDKHYPDWKAVQAFDSSVFGYATGFFYIMGIFFLIREIRGSRQFRPRRMWNELEVEENAESSPDQREATAAESIEGNSNAASRQQTV